MNLKKSNKAMHLFIGVWAIKIAPSAPPPPSLVRQPYAFVVEKTRKQQFRYFACLSSFSSLFLIICLVFVALLLEVYLKILDYKLIK